MTEKHKQAISRGLRKLRKRRRLSAAMKASWARRRDNAIANAKVTIVEYKPKQKTSAPEVRNLHPMHVKVRNNMPDHLVSQIVDLIDENNRYRELIAKLQNALK